ncbi:MAG: cytochrome c oxidase accessory protein CcoG [Alphaproteobacteria bacterium]
MPNNTNIPADDVLYASRGKIYPKRVSGTFRRLKWTAMAVLLAIYYLAPWIRWDRGPNAPDQAILIDMPARRFYFFFIELWPQEVYYITGVLIAAGIGLFLSNALVGRAWCGYACPQTVWTDLYIHVERWVEGDRSARMRLDKSPWSLGKIRKRIIKHAIWILIAVATGGAWVFYFADAPTLMGQLFTFDAPFAAYLWIGIFTATTYTLGGLAREQVCTYMCPWPRIQAAMTDEEALNVSYRTDRGEPRGIHKKGTTWEGRGDCIDCKACVNVCPMGIDIRDGAQLECIHCALCIDACDEIMDKIERPRGLIGYDNDRRIAARAAGEPQPSLRYIRPRTVLYAGMIAIVGIVMVVSLFTRDDFDITVQHDRNPHFVQLSSGDIRNAYTVKISNKKAVERSYRLTLPDLPDAQLASIGLAEAPLENGLIVTVPPDDLRSVRVTVTAPRMTAGQDGSVPVHFQIYEYESRKTDNASDFFKGPTR